MMNFITTSLQKKIISEDLEGFNLYLFGSSLHSLKANDIDLLIEYDETIINIDKALKFRIKVIEILTNIIGHEIDICLLSTSEHFQTQFIKTEKGKLLPLNRVQHS